MKTLIAGFGNILHGDDGFGVEVIRALGHEDLPPETEALEVGIGGFDFVLKLIDRFDRAVVIDAVRRGERAGTLYVFSPAEHDLHHGEVVFTPHLTEPLRAFRLASRLHVLPHSVTVVGCETMTTELGIGLSEPVRAAVPLAVTKVKELLISG